MIWIGYAASILVTIAYTPQTINCITTGSSGLTSQTLGLLLAAMVLWILHGIITKDWPLVLSSLISLLQLLFLAIFPYVKNKFRKARC